MKFFITGGAGFIGSNCAHHFAAQGHDITIYDNLSRVGGQANLDWLRQQHGDGAETTALTGVYHNLLRMWADT